MKIATHTGSTTIASSTVSHVGAMIEGDATASATA